MSMLTAYGFQAKPINPNDWQWQKDAAGQDLAFLIYTDKANEWRWAAKAANNRRIADGGEGYVNRGDCVAGAKRMGFRGV